MNRSRMLLLLIVLLVGALWYAWQETPRQQRVSSESSDRGTDVIATDEAAETAIATLNLPADQAEDYSNPQRDLFRPLYRPPVVVRVPVAPPKPPPVVKPPPAPKPPPPPPPVVRQPVREKPIPPLNVLGFLQKAEQMTVFLGTRQGDIYLVNKGDTFADDLLVRELDDSKIVISRNLTDAGVTLALGEKKNQRMSVPNLPSGRPSVPQINLNIPKTGAPAAPGENQ